MRWYRRRIAGTVVCLLAATVAGGWTWHRRDMDRRVDEALAAVERRGGPPIDTDLIRSLEGSSRYDHEVRLLRAVSLMRGGEPAIALKILGGLRPEGRIRVPLLIAAGEAYYRTGQLADAERIFRRLSSEQPDLALTHRWLATIYHDLGAMPESGRHLERVAELEPDDFFAYRLMGLLYLKDYAKHREAAEQYRMALARNPPAKYLQSIRTELAEALVGLHDYTGALDVLATAEQDATVVGLEAECYWSMGNTEKAAQQLARARELDPGTRSVLSLTATMAMEQNQAQAAIEPLKTLVERDPLDAQACYQLLRAYQRLGEKAAAAEVEERMNEAKNLRKELTDLYREVMRSPGDAERREALAELCDRLGKPEIARLWRRAADQVRRAEDDLSTVVPP